MELKVKGWSRNSNKAARPLKNSNLQSEAKLRNRISIGETSVQTRAGRFLPKVGQMYPVRAVDISFGINLNNVGGDYLSTLSLTREDIAFLYCLCFEDDTVDRSAGALEKARIVLREMRASEKTRAA